MSRACLKKGDVARVRQRAGLCCGVRHIRNKTNLAEPGRYEGDLSSASLMLQRRTSSRRLPVGTARHGFGVALPVSALAGSGLSAAAAVCRDCRTEAARREGHPAGVGAAGVWKGRRADEGELFFCWLV